ncbi:hypothetical protein CJF42_23220 [Pseudoalteromonas sp. NBT06-2]|uniref:hypothetical protein n=1 Tax=Pseudoalteromonas sp. NBT06-2 TaxID=2025950 RepID=UPI000BA6C54C|nr:hypothetical protein [Pseudoalteromonas sp. NBT06-2]PAJ72067.1 hypothetical protein CJF42_23220 [Pseudoalteromonas sp. NBT06-2]
MTTKVNKFNAGTGSFQKKTKPGSTAFAMSSSSWLTLQTFFNNVAVLPSTTAALATNMGPGAPSDMSDYEKLVALYAKMITQDSGFTTTLYPSIVELASDVYNYAEAVPEYYAGLQELISPLSATPAPTGQALTTIQTNLTAVLDQLASNISPFITKAGNVKAELNTLVNKLETYLTTLGSDSPQPKGSGYWQ